MQISAFLLSVSKREVTLTHQIADHCIHCMIKVISFDRNKRLILHRSLEERIFISAIILPDYHRSFARFFFFYKAHLIRLLSRCLACEHVFDTVQMILIWPARETALPAMLIGEVFFNWCKLCSPRSGIGTLNFSQRSISINLTLETSRRYGRGNKNAPHYSVSRWPPGGGNKLTLVTLPTDRVLRED